MKSASKMPQHFCTFLSTTELALGKKKFGSFITIEESKYKPINICSNEGMLWENIHLNFLSLSCVFIIIILESPKVTKLVEKRIFYMKK